MIHTEMESQILKRRYQVIYTFIYGLIIMLMVIVNTYTGDLNFIHSENSIFIQPDDFNEDYRVQELELDNQRHFQYTVDIEDTAFQQMTGAEYRVLINGIKDNAIQVWFNDHLIISEGDVDKGKSTLRSSHVYGSIETANIKSQNRLRIETYADYRTGIDDQVIISEKRIGDRAIRLLDLFNSQFIYLGLGLIFMSVFFLFVLYLLNYKDNKLLLFLGMATILIGFYFVDFLPLHYLSNQYIMYKKILLLFLSLGIYFYGRAIHLLIPKKRVMVFPILQLIYYIFIMVISQDIMQFRNYYNYFYASLIFIAFGFLLNSFIHQDKDSKLLILALHFFTLFFLGILRLAIGAKHGYFSLAMSIFIMFTISFLPMILAFDFLLDKQLRIQVEKKQRKVAQDESMTDDLTGVWNKRYLENRLYDLQNETVVALVDLDNLKTINDTYGHLAGDLMLTTLAQKMKKYLDEHDEICRYGGDEFIILFSTEQIQDAVKTVEKIRQEFAKEVVDYDGHHLKATISVGIALVSDQVYGKELIKFADQRLYAAKRSGRNKVVTPEFY